MKTTKNKFQKCNCIYKLWTPFRASNNEKTQPHRQSRMRRKNQRLQDSLFKIWKCKTLLVEMTWMPLTSYLTLYSKKRIYFIFVFQVIWNSGRISESGKNSFGAPPLLNPPPPSLCIFLLKAFWTCTINLYLQLKKISNVYHKYVPQKKFLKKARFFGRTK